MRTMRTMIALIGGAILLSADVSQALSLLPAPAGKRGGHGDASSGVSFRVVGGEASMATLFLPDLTRRELPIHNGEVTVPPTGVSSYHALVVESVVAGTERVAIAYVYGRGKSSGHSPSDVLNLDKTALEIVPDPLPREHWRYMAGDPYRFLLRFKGSPLPGATVTLITGNGSTMVAISDETGAVEFSLPDDFTNVKPGRSNNPPASFTVSVSLSDGATKYETSLDAVYHVNPNGHWLIGSVGWGIVSFGAFVGGIVSWRRTRQFSKGGGA